MDQDYGVSHRSAPHCNGMRSTYSYSYGRPNWGWRPSGCSPVTVPEADPDDPFATGLTVTIRADDIMVLWDRVDALRVRHDLAAFTWDGRDNYSRGDAGKGCPSHGTAYSTE